MPRFPNHAKFSAFGLIEVLIAVVVLSVSLLGLASLQSRAIQNLQEGDNLVTAAMIAREMAERMLSNPYVTSLGRQGYLVTDLSNEISGPENVLSWASSELVSNPDITRCYSADNTESCFAPSGSYASSSDHQTALTNMQLMDEVEIRSLAAVMLPEGEIKICFDSSGALTDWECDDTASRIETYLENVYTIKVRWRNIYTNAQQIYGLQITAKCTDSGVTYCG